MAGLSAMNSAARRYQARQNPRTPAPLHREDVPSRLSGRRLALSSRRTADCRGCSSIPGRFTISRQSRCRALAWTMVADFLQGQAGEIITEFLGYPHVHLVVHQLQRGLGGLRDLSREFLTPPQPCSRKRVYSLTTPPILPPIMTFKRRLRLPRLLSRRCAAWLRGSQDRLCRPFY